LSNSCGNSQDHSRGNSQERLQNVTRYLQQILHANTFSDYFNSRESSRTSLDRSGTWGDELLITDLNFLALSPVTYFSPREELEEIANVFETRKGTPTTVCCTVGIGGAGKTQLALRYAHDRFRKTYSAVFWIDASDHEKLTSSFLRIARILGLAVPVQFASDGARKAIAKRWESDYIVAVKEWLIKRRGYWLLIFDNVDDLTVINILQRYFPMSEQGHIIVTSRREEAYKLATGVVTVKGLLPKVAATLLLHHAGIENPSDEQNEQAEVIADQLGCLALAVDLAGGFIKKFHGDLDNYLKLYLQSKETVLKKSMGAVSNASGSSYPWSVFAAWGISIASMRLVTGQFISLLSFLDRTNITLDLFRRSCQNRSRWTLGGALAEVSPKEGGVPEWILDNFITNGEWDEIAFLETVDELCSYSFAKIDTIPGPVMYPYEDSIVYEISAEKPRKLITLHPLLHEVARLWLTDDEQCQYARDAECLIWHSIDDDATKAMRSEDSSYSPIFTLGGGASSSAVSLALRLDEAYRHVYQFALPDLTKKLQKRGDFHDPFMQFSAGLPEVGRLPSLYFCFILVFLLRVNEVNCVSKLVPCRINWDFFTEELRKLDLLRRKDLSMQWMRLGSRLKSRELWYRDGVDNAVSAAALEEMYLFQIKLKRDKLERTEVSSTDLEIKQSGTDWDLLKGSDILQNVILGFKALGIPLPIV
jgi:NB-ARC domain